MEVAVVSRVVRPITQTVFEVLSVEHVRLVSVPNIEQEQIGIVAMIHEVSVAAKPRRDFFRQRLLDALEERQRVGRQLLFREHFYLRCENARAADPNPAMTDGEIQKRIADEARVAFEASEDPCYSVDTDTYAAALVETLKHRTQSADLAAVGDQVMNGFRAYFTGGDLGQLLLSVEAFVKFLLEFTDREKFRLLNEEKGDKLSLTAVLKALRLLTNKTNTELPATDYIGAPRFAEHVCRVVATRNLLAHRAPMMSPRAKAQVFESTCVFLLFAVAEQFEAVLSTLLIKGTEVDADVTRALALISSSAEAGFVPAMRHMSDVKFDAAWGELSRSRRLAAPRC